MKNIALLIGAILFSILFHKQSIGLNLGLFSLITITALAVYNKNAFKRRSTIVYCIIYVITALAIFLYQSNLSIIANCIAFFTLIGHVSEHKASIYINWLNGLYTFIAGFFHRNFNDLENKRKAKKDIDYLHLTKIIGIPLITIIIFIFLYKNGNPVFNDLINKINFDFINFQWLLLTVLGYYLLYNISTPIKVDPATQADLNSDNILKLKGELSIDHAKKENQLGFILIVLLNILIAFFLITDITYLIDSNDFRASVFSNQVHSGINALIASIVIAIAIILYFFRGNLNFYKDNTNLKTATYIWILLNIILVVNIAIKDYQYIYYFGFTYKRIGVLIYLLLTIIGLITTFIKVKQVKNLLYLLRINTVTAFSILIIACVINWDKHITYYNLNYAKSMDFNYLINLSNNNTLLLKNHANHHDLNYEKKDLIDKKYAQYINELNTKNWQELSYDNFKVTSK